MLKANKSAWFAFIFALYNRTLFWRRFQNLRVANLDSLRNRDENTPLVLYANHSSFWDGLLLFEISRAAKLDFYVMMEEKQLRNLPLFRLLGAFSVVRENPRQAVQSMRYAVNLLKQNSKRGLWIFPQGEVLPNDSRPLKFFNGLAKIVQQVGKCQAVSVAMRYEFLHDFKPLALARIGEIEFYENVKDAKSLTDSLNHSLTANLDTVKLNVAENDLKDYENII